jgi:trigger factor
LNIQTKELEHRQVQLTVEVPEDQKSAAMRAAARRLSKQAKIPGFRPGKAPYDVIVGKFGQEVVFEEALEQLGQDVYRKSLEELDLDPYAPGSLDEVVSRNPLVIQYTVPLTPEIDLGDYHSVRIPFEEPQITDEAVEAMMEDLRQRQALVEPVERPAEETDLLVIDVKGELADPEAGEDSVLLDSKGISVLVQEDTDFPYPGVYKDLLGLNQGDEKELEHTFPGDYSLDELRNRRAVFHIACVGVRSRLVPEWSDDLAQIVGDFESLLDLRIKVREGLVDQAKRTADSDYAEEVMLAVLEGAKIDFPPVVIEEEQHRMMHEFESQLRSQNLTLEDYLKIEGKSEQDVLGEFEPAAKERANRGMVLGKVVEVEGIEVSEEDISQKIDDMLAPLGESTDKALRGVFDTPQGRSRIGIDLLTDKAMQCLVDIARDEYVAQIAAEETESDETPPEGEAEIVEQEEKE